MNETEVVIVSAVRTAIGSFLGGLKSIKATTLGGIVIKAALEKAGIDGTQVDEIIMGNVLQAGLGQNPARQAALAAGLPHEVSALTINKVCGSGLKAVHLATQAILAGDADVIVAGGMENMSQAPFLLRGARDGFKMGDQKIVDSMIHDGLWCAFNNYHMGITAENLSAKYEISREEQDEFSAWSQQKPKLRLNRIALRMKLYPLKCQVVKGKYRYSHKTNFPGGYYCRKFRKASPCI